MARVENRQARRLAEDIRDWMTEQRLGPGDPLPSLRDLARLFGATRTSLRSALGRLAAENIVAVGPAATAEVPSDRSGGGSSALDALLADGGSFAEIADLRSLVAPELAARLAGRLDTRGLMLLHDAVLPDPAGMTPQQALAAMFRSEFAFHSRLCRLSEAPPLAMVCAILARAQHDRGTARAPGTPASPEFTRRFQLRLITALAEGDAARARTLMRDHLERTCHLARADDARAPPLVAE